MDETNGTSLVIKDIFEAWDTNKSGYIEKAELSECCQDLKLSDIELERVFNELDVNKDGRISLSDFYESFGKVCSLFHVSQNEVLFQDVSEYKKFEKLLDAIGFQNYLTGHEYVTEMFHHMQNSGDSPQLLSLLESFLFSVIRDIKTYESENQKLEDALKRTCEKHAEHMENLDEEMENQLSKFEKRIKKEEQTKYERSSMDIIWQMENKNKEIQALQARVQKLETKLKRKEPEEQKLKEEIEERVQEIRYLRSQVTDAQTNMAVLRSELVQARNDYEDQAVLLQNEKHTVMECVQEQESLTRQLQLLHEANKKLHDTNDNLRSALEAKRGSETGRSPSPNKRSSISTLYSPAPKPYKRTKSTSNSPGFSNESEDRLSTSLGAIPLRSPLNSTANSRRSSLLLPVQQSAEEDEARTNEDSLLEEFIGVNYRHMNLPDGTEEEDEAYGTLPSSERESMRMQLNLLTETNKRLCESNSDLRLALETVTKRVPKAKSREKCKRNPSFHSDYGSISSRSATPSQLQGPKSENDVADGAEDLSGYEPESDGNNTSTLTLQGRHEEQPDGLSKTLAEPRERIKIAGRDTGDVIWEDGNELETADEEVERHGDANGDGRIGDTPFTRNSLLRKPLRHKSIEALASEMESKKATGEKGGGRSNWPAIARNGKWNSMEQVRKNNDFVGTRSRSLPASRCQSSESLDFQTGVGLNELSEKLNALKTNQENASLETENPESEECGICRDTKADIVPVTVEAEHNEGKEVMPEASPKEDTSIQVENKVQHSPSKSTNTVKTEMVSSAVQVNLSSGRSTPQETKSSHSKQTKDKRKEKHSPRKAKTAAIKDPSEKKCADFTESSKRQLEDTKGQSEGAKEGSNASSISRLSNREESPFRSTSTRPYSQNSNSNTLPHKNLLNKSPYESPRSTPKLVKESKNGKEKDPGNRGRSEILSLIAGERPGQDLKTVQNLRIDVDINSKPQTNSNVNTDLNRSITNDIFAPLNKSCPNFSTRQSASDQGQPERNIGLNSSRSSWLKLHKASPYGGALVNRVKQTESVADSDLSRVELLSAELEAQFKSVKEEDEEDIDEDDVDDEELAQLVAMATGLSESDEETESELDSPEGLRPTTIGTADLSEASTNTPYSQSTTQDLVPERLFKLVLAGDAAVGKSSFILRLCRNRFHNALNSTLGVDFQMKNLVVDGKTIALQLWDTAGQERFRSIAKSYFRKADGVLLLYDVTCETSFLDVRDWVEAIEESCTKPVPIMMCGNKTDLRPGNIAEGKTVISTESGQKIAKEYGALFMETSAKDNTNIEEACVKLARMLQDLEDIDLHKDQGMQLSEADAKQKKKSSCCLR